MSKVVNNSIVCGGQISTKGYLAGNRLCGVDRDVSKVVHVMRVGDCKSFICQKCGGKFRVICYGESRDMESEELLDFDSEIGVVAIFSSNLI
ncbi:hypothetical protein ACFL08_01680 [Patescibacteria group bacterium]